MQTYRSANLQTDHMVSQSEVARMLNVSERSVSGHGAGHEASNVYAIKRSTIPVVNWPNHRPPNPVRLGYHGLGRYIPPFVLDANAIVAILGFPIRVQHDTTISIGATGALAARKLFKPWLERRVGKAPVGITSIRRLQDQQDGNKDGREP